MPVPAPQQRVAGARPGRHPAYLASRLRAVAGRYGVTTEKAKRRVRRFLRNLEPYGLAPTFATPGSVVEGDASFFRELHEAGAELAIHGYDHADFRRLSRAQAAWQMRRAIDAYTRHRIPFDGFRCPYLSLTPDVRAVLPAGAFTYSSNLAVAWPLAGVRAEGPVFDQLAANYRPALADEVVCCPRLEGELVEIPASVPDDLQLCDALDLGPEGVARCWVDTLREAHRREELFAPLFHPEACELLEEAIVGVLADAAGRRPAVWLTQLREVARWWRERAAFAVTTQRCDGALWLTLDCTPRATVLVRDWQAAGALRPWAGRWSLLDAREVRLDGDVHPFVAAPDLDVETVAFLREQGFIVVEGRDAERCAVTLARSTVEALGSRRALVDHLERSAGALLRFGRWPDGAMSAFCLAGDLDALSIRDYAQRLRPSVRARRGSP